MQTPNQLIARARRLIALLDGLELDAAKADEACVASAARRSAQALTNAANLREAELRGELLHR